MLIFCRRRAAILPPRRSAKRSLILRAAVPDARRHDSRLLAHYRSGKSEEVVLALEKAVAIEPENGYARRNLGGILGARSLYAEAVPHMRAAARLLPNDQATLYGLAHCLALTGEAEKVVEADELYGQVIALDGNTDIAQKAEGAP